MQVLRLILRYQKEGFKNIKETVDALKQIKGVTAEIDDSGLKSIGKTTEDIGDNVARLSKKISGTIDATIKSTAKGIETTADSTGRNVNASIEKTATKLVLAFGALKLISFEPVSEALVRVLLESKTGFQLILNTIKEIPGLLAEAATWLKELVAGGNTFATILTAIESRLLKFRSLLLDFLIGSKSIVATWLSLTGFLATSALGLFVIRKALSEARILLRRMVGLGTESLNPLERITRLMTTLDGAIASVGIRAGTFIKLGGAILSFFVGPLNFILSAMFTANSIIDLIIRGTERLRQKSLAVAGSARAVVVLLAFELKKIGERILPGIVTQSKAFATLTKESIKAKDSLQLIEQQQKRNEKAAAKTEATEAKAQARLARRAERRRTSFIKSNNLFLKLRGKLEATRKRADANAALGTKKISDLEAIKTKRVIKFNELLAQSRDKTTERAIQRTSDLIIATSKQLDQQAASVKTFSDKAKQATIGIAKAQDKVAEKAKKVKPAIEEGLNFKFAVDKSREFKQVATAAFIDSEAGAKSLRNEMKRFENLKGLDRIALPLGAQLQFISTEFKSVLSELLIKLEKIFNLLRVSFGTTEKELNTVEQQSNRALNTIFSGIKRSSEIMETAFKGTGKTAFRDLAEGGGALRRVLIDTNDELTKSQKFIKRELPTFSKIVGVTVGTISGLTIKPFNLLRRSLKKVKTGELPTIKESFVETFTSIKNVTSNAFKGLDKKLGGLGAKGLRALFGESQKIKKSFEEGSQSVKKITDAVGRTTTEAKGTETEVEQIAKIFPKIQNEAVTVAKTIKDQVSVNLTTVSGQLTSIMGQVERLSAMLIGHINEFKSSLGGFKGPILEILTIGQRMVLQNQAIVDILLKSKSGLADIAKVAKDKAFEDLSAKMEKVKETTKEFKKEVNKTRKSVLKIPDGISLAQAKTLALGGSVGIVKQKLVESGVATKSLLDITSTLNDRLQETQNKTGKIVEDVTRAKDQVREFFKQFKEIKSPFAGSIPTKFIGPQLETQLNRIINKLATKLVPQLPIKTFDALSGKIIAIVDKTSKIEEISRLIALSARLTTDRVRESNKAFVELKQTVIDTRIDVDQIRFVKLITDIQNLIGFVKSLRAQFGLFVSPKVVAEINKRLKSIDLQSIFTKKLTLKGFDTTKIKTDLKKAIDVTDAVRKLGNTITSIGDKVKEKTDTIASSARIITGEVIKQKDQMTALVEKEELRFIASLNYMKSFGQAFGMISTFSRSLERLKKIEEIPAKLQKRHLAGFSEENLNRLRLLISSVNTRAAGGLKLLQRWAMEFGTIGLLAKLLVATNSKLAGTYEKIVDTIQPQEKTLKRITEGVQKRSKFLKMSKDEEDKLVGSMVLQEQLSTRLSVLQKSFIKPIDQLDAEWGQTNKAIIKATEESRRLPTTIDQAKASMKGLVIEILTAQGSFDVFLKLGQVFKSLGKGTALGDLLVMLQKFGDGLATVEALRASFAKFFKTVMAGAPEELARRLQMVFNVINDFKPQKLSEITKQLESFQKLLGARSARVAGLKFGEELSQSLQSGKVTSKVRKGAEILATIIRGHFPESPAKFGPLKTLRRGGTEIGSQLFLGMKGGIAAAGKGANQIAKEIRDHFPNTDAKKGKLQKLKRGGALIGVILADGMITGGVGFAVAAAGKLASKIFFGITTPLVKKLQGFFFTLGPRLSKWLQESISGRVVSKIFKLGVKLGAAISRGFMSGFRRFQQFLTRLPQLVSRGVGGAVRVIEKGAELAEFSKRSGVATEQLGAMQNALAETGGQLTDLQFAFLRINESLGKVLPPEDVKKFKSLGIDINEIRKTQEPTLVLFKKIADVIKTLPPTSNEFKRALELIGVTVSNTGLINLLLRGSKEITRLQKQAVKLGIVMPKAFLEAAIKVRGLINRIKLLGTAVVNQLLVSLLPHLEALGNILTNFVERHGAFISAILQSIAQGFVIAIKMFIRFIKFMIEQPEKATDFILDVMREFFSLAISMFEEFSSVLFNLAQIMVKRIILFIASAGKAFVINFFKELIDSIEATFQTALLLLTERFGKAFIGFLQGLQKAIEPFVFALRQIPEALRPKFLDDAIKTLHQFTTLKKTDLTDLLVADIEGKLDELKKRAFSLSEVINKTIQEAGEETRKNVQGARIEFTGLVDKEAFNRLKASIQTFLGGLDKAFEGTPLEDLRDEFKDLFKIENFGQKVSDLDTLKEKLLELIEAANKEKEGGGLVKIVDLQILNETLSSAEERLNKFKDKLGKSLVLEPTKVDSFKTLVSSLFEGFNKPFEDFGVKAKTALGDLSIILESAVSGTVLEGFKEKFQSIFKIDTEITRMKLEEMKTLLIQAFEDINAQLGEDPALKPLLDNLKSIKDVAIDVLGTIETKVKDVAKTQEEAFGKVVDNLVGAMNAGSEAVGMLFEKSKKKMKGFFIAQKALAIAAAVVNTAQGATEAYKDTTNVGTAAKLAAAGVIIASGAIQIAKIIATTVSGFAKGGRVTSGSPGSTKDDVPAMLQRDEFVLNRRAVKFYGANFAESVNKLRFPLSLTRGFDFPDLQKGIEANDILAFQAGGPVGKPIGTQVTEREHPISGRQRLEERFTILNSVSPDITAQHLATREGQNLVLNVIANNSDSVNALLEQDRR